MQSGKTIEVLFEMTKVCKAVWLLTEHKVCLSALEDQWRAAQWNNTETKHNDNTLL
jgi:hypothetical protein